MKKYLVTVVVGLLPCFQLSAAVLENGLVRLAFDEKGCVSSLQEKATGRELVKTPVPFVSVMDVKGATHAPTQDR